MLESLLGLKDVQKNLQEIQPGGCYWIRCQNEHDALALVVFSPLAKRVKPRSLLFSAPLPETLLASLGSALEGCEVLSLETGEPKRFFEGLAHQMEFDHSLSGRTLFALFPGSAFTALDQASLYPYFAAAKGFAASRGFSVVFLPTGDLPDVCLSFVFRHFSLFDGVASLTPQGSEFNWVSLLWKAANGISHSVDLHLKFSPDEGFSLSEVLTGEAAGEDADTFFVVALNSEFRLTDREAVYVDSNREAFERGMQAFEASILFALSNVQEIEALARMIYELRLGRGNHLKIYVREKPDYVRGNTEEMLLEAGADMVFPKSTPQSHYSAVLQSLKNNTYTRTLPASFEAFLARHRTIELRGPLSLADFTAAMLAFCTNHAGKNELPGTLVQLRLRDAIPSHSALELFHPHRLGDIGSVWKRTALVFFNNCSPGNVETALNNAFLLPLTQLFEGYTAETHPAAVEKLCRELEAAAAGSPRLYTVPASGPETKKKPRGSKDPETWISGNPVTPVFIPNPRFEGKADHA
jgi:cellulose biosynthesis protein BcsE